MNSDVARPLIVSRLRRGCLLLATLVPACCCVPPAVADEIRPTPAGDRVAMFLQAYCVDCHGPETQKGDRRFDSLDIGNLDNDAMFDMQDAIDQLTLGDMPPPEVDPPSEAKRGEIIALLTEALTAARADRDSTGRRTVLRRLNHREYVNTIRDLFDMEMSMFDPTSRFPRDNTAEHFDNIGDTLVTSGYLLEQYLVAADAIVEKAFARDEPVEPKTWTFRGNFDQQPELRAGHKEAFDFRYMCLYDCPEAERPEGAYGPLKEFAEGVPLDGIYEIRVRAHAVNRDTPYDESILKIDLDEPFRLGIVPGDLSLSEPHTMQPIQPLLAETPIDDGEPKWYTFEVPLDQGFSPRFTFQNGMVEVRPTYGRVMRQYRDTLPKGSRDAKGIFRERIALIKDGKLPHIRIHEVEIRGPIDAGGVSRSRQAVLGEEPFERSRTREVLARFLRRAYRRPPTEDEIGRINALVDVRIEQGHEPIEALQDGLKAALCSPAFLYVQPADAVIGTDQDITVRSDDGTTDVPRRLSPHAIASRLSYFLWATMPDERLMALADSGEILDPSVVREEVRRMLTDERSEAFLEGFLDSWLNLRTLGEMPPDRNRFEAYYADGLEHDMKRETQLFVRHLIDEDLSALDLLRADYSFLNRDLAKLYGVADEVPPEEGHRFRRVAFDDPERGGLLGHASVLTVTANGIETSPIIRGVWMLENILGTPTPPPPDDVPAIDPDVRGATSIRDLLEKHRTSAACNECHRKIDPLGFALEAFDPIGRVRDQYPNKTPIETSGTMPSGRSFDGVAGLKRILAERHEFFARTLTERLLTYALGRRVEPSDRHSVDDIVASVADDEYPMRALIEAIASSDAFRRP